MSELLALLGDHVVGAVTRGRSGRLSFVYDDAWRRLRGAYPLSLSMPLAASEHRHAVVEAFLWGLLPDNERVLERWGKEFQVSARDAFSLLAHVGEDCAGAVRFTRPARAARLAREGEGEIQWLDASAIGERLRDLRADVSAWRRPDDAGQFSLAGAQPKTALYFDGERWGVPSGRIPTTHILKPGAPGLDGHAEDEHFCLALAAELGFPVATSRVQRFDGEVAIVVERYDRVRKSDRVLRVHQEDLCQSLGVHPAKKYESGGGPGVRAIVALLRESSRRPAEDVETFVSALAYEWLVAATDGHAKNFSVLIGAGGAVRLAPLYDIASVLPYVDARLWKTKLAMKIGGEYRVREIGRRQWQKLASELGLDADDLVGRVISLAERIPDAATKVRALGRRERVADAAARRLADAVTARARACVSALAS